MLGNSFATPGDPLLNYFVYDAHGRQNKTRRNNRQNYLVHISLRYAKETKLTDFSAPYVVMGWNDTSFTWRP